MTEKLKSYRDERDRLLQRAKVLLEEDSRVVAAWLFGSFGRGETDELSDLDLWVVVEDDAIQSLLANRREWVGKAGSPILILDYPDNGPTEGGYMMALYPGEDGPHEVDWYWQPQTGAMIPRNARLLFDHVGLPSVEPPLVSSSELPENRKERAKSAENHINFFWAMVPIAAKYAARRKAWDALGMITMVQKTLWETRQDVEGLVVEGINERADPRRTQHKPPVEPQEQLTYLCGLADAMVALRPQSQALGVAFPDKAAASVYRFLNLMQVKLNDEAI